MADRGCPEALAGVFFPGRGLGADGAALVEAIEGKLPKGFWDRHPPSVR